MENVNYPISHIGQLDNVRSKGASTWTAATLFNALADAQAYSRARGIPPPAVGINVWLFPDFKTGGTGSAPMLRKIATTSDVSRTIDFLLAGTGTVGALIVKQILQRQLPDITIFYGGDQGALSSSQINPIFYHELGHTQHYNQVGNSFWTAYIAHIVDRLGYGQKSDGGSGRIAISEGWGNYIENAFMINKYTNTKAGRLSDYALITLENQIPDDDYGIQTSRGQFSRGWFSYGLYYDMTDNTEPALTGVTDNVSGFTTATVFRGLQPDVLTVRGYQARIQAQTGGLQAPQMEQLVTSYRW